MKTEAIQRVDTTPVTGRDGRACFEASFLREWPQVLQSDGSVPETRREVECEVTVTKIGYEPKSFSLAHALGVTFITHSTKLAEIVVEMKREPNQTSEINSRGRRPKFGKVAVFGRLAPRVSHRGVRQTARCESGS